MSVNLLTIIDMTDEEKSDVHINHLDEWEGISKLGPSTIYLVEVK